MASATTEATTSMLDSMVAASTFESTTMGIDTTTSTDDETTTVQVSPLEDTSTDHDDIIIYTHFYS